MMTMQWRDLGQYIGLCVLVLSAAGCPTGGVGNNNNDNTNENQNDNENDNTDDNENENGNDNSDVEAGVELEIPNEGAQHVSVGEQATYQSNPPASGPHWSQGGFAPVPAGVYETALEEEQWVHNLEHGYVVVLYDCGGPCLPALLDDFQDFFDSAPPSQEFGNTKLVITPYSGLPFFLTAVSWDRQLHLETLDEAALLDFYETHVDHGPEHVP